MGSPQLSIITINLNNAQGLSKTLKSIWENQSFTDMEHIVIDGGSSDGSIDIIQKYADRLAQWVSEPDKGIYNAMNKGIVRAQGEYLLFLNSGDTLESDILSRLFLQGLHSDIVYGKIRFCETSGNQYTMTFPEKISFQHLYTSYLPHPCSFIKRTLFENNLYNEQLKIASDWAFFIEMILFKGCSTQYIPEVITNFDMAGISNNNTLSVTERQDVLTTLFSPLGKEYIDQAIVNENTLNEIFRNKPHFRQNQKIIRFLRKMIKITSPLLSYIGRKER